MRIIGRIGLVLAAGVIASASLVAHHSFAMFEMDKDVKYSGLVTDWKWQNPHVHFTVLVKAGAGVDPQTVGTWDVEGGSVNIMTRQGWTRASYKTGDRITAGRPPDEGRLERHFAVLRRPSGRHPALPRHRTSKRRREEGGREVAGRRWPSSVACRTAHSPTGSSGRHPSGRIPPC